jgi:hypothetical protein
MAKRMVVDMEIPPKLSLSDSGVCMIRIISDPASVFFLILQTCTLFFKLRQEITFFGMYC